MDKHWKKRSSLIEGIDDKGRKVLLPANRKVPAHVKLPKQANQGGNPNAKTN